MSSFAVIIIVGVVLVGLFGVVDYIIRTSIGKAKIREAEEKAKEIIKSAERELEIRQKELEIKVQKELYESKAAFERSTRNIRREIEKKTKELKLLESSLEKKADMIERKELALANREKSIQTKERALMMKEEELNNLIEIQNKKLEQIAGMTSEEAKKLLMDNLVNQARAEASQMIKEIREEAERRAEKEAKEIIISAIQRCSVDVTQESTVTVITLPSDELKGRVIGREGRNIRAFEIATGVDVIVDDTPEAIILSSFDPIKREIARLAMEKLITDGRIHPARIEEAVEKSKKEVEIMIQEAGEQTVFELSIFNLPQELVYTLGKLKFRTSYGQNVLAHSKDVAYLSGFMAAELGLDANLARRAGLLHDIGKAIDRAMEGTHTQLGAELAKKYNEDPVVINAILGHHGDIPPISPITVLVQAADAISGSRPGARRETLESYIKRLERLEEIADSFQGVAKSYAIQAGREIRVIVDPEALSDKDAEFLAAEIAQKIQSELEYPGQIRVTVIREKRAIEYAK